MGSQALNITERTKVPLFWLIGVFIVISPFAVNGIIRFAKIETTASYAASKVDVHDKAIQDMKDSLYRLEYRFGTLPKEKRHEHAEGD